MLTKTLICEYNKVVYEWLWYILKHCCKVRLGKQLSCGSAVHFAGGTHLKGKAKQGKTR